MTSQRENFRIAFARPVERDLLPRRRPIVLGDGYETAAYVHAPRGAVRTAVVYLHGIQSHPGWYVGSGDYLASLGHPVWHVIRRGSGDNLVDRGHAESCGQLLEDLDIACRLAAGDEGAKVHLVGVSWGGKLAACYAGRPGYARKLASLTLVCPGIATRVSVSAAKKFAIAISLLAQPRRLFDIPLNDVSLFTNNPQMREYLRGDLCRLHRATARFLFVSRWMDRMLRSSKRALGVTTSLILAADDRIIDNDRTVEAVTRLAGERLEVTELPGCHTLEFEADPKPLYEAIARGVSRGLSIQLDE